MSLALSIRRARASASIFSSAWKFSTRIRRTTSRARVSSRTSASLRPTSRLTTASDIRPATSSLRAMPEETGYTDANRGVKHNYPENRSKLAVEAGEKQAKPGAFPGQALDLDAATVGLGEGLHEAEAEPQTPGGRRLRMGDPHVLVEDAGQLLSRDADAIVLDRHLDHSRVVRRRTGRHVDSTAPRRVLHRIGQEVLHHTIQRVRIHLDGRPGRAGGPAEAVAAMLGREQLGVALQQRVEIDRLGAQLERSPRLDPGEIEQLAHDTAERARLGMEVHQAATRLLRRQGGAKQQLTEALQGGQRRAQLVGDHREELGLGLI